MTSARRTTALSTKETAELLKNRIEIRTRGFVNQIFSGEYHSVFKGRGMAFSEVREYQFGDDVRTIDWNVSARFNHPFVKVFEEERELTVILLVDVSGSGDFGTVHQLKRDTAAELCAVLAFSALKNNDKVGVIFFSDRVEKFIPPKKGRSHVRGPSAGHHLPAGTPPRHHRGLRFLTALPRNGHRLPDLRFHDGRYEDVKIAGKKHDLAGIKLFDLRRPTAGGPGGRWTQKRGPLWTRRPGARKHMRGGGRRWRRRVSGRSAAGSRRDQDQDRPARVKPLMMFSG